MGVLLVIFFILASACNLYIGDYCKVGFFGVICSVFKWLVKVFSRIFQNAQRVVGCNACEKGANFFGGQFVRFLGFHSENPFRKKREGKQKQITLDLVGG